MASRHYPVSRLTPIAIAAAANHTACAAMPGKNNKNQEVHTQDCTQRKRGVGVVCMWEGTPSAREHRALRHTIASVENNMVNT